MHISGSIDPITVICQFWSKVMLTEVKQGQMLITVSYHLHRRQLVKFEIIFILKLYS